MGIRMALGAQRADIIELVIRSAAGTVLTGIVFGLVLSIAVNRIVAHWVQSSSRDPLVLASVAILLLMIAAGACLWPARRASTVDPVQALRAE
jgi:ABC-type antimicrobial peptide transport system permease subunit